MDARPKLNVTFDLLPMNERNSVIGKRMKFNVQDFFSKHEQNSGFVHIYKLFYKQHFYKQRQAEICRKSNKC